MFQVDKSSVKQRMKKLEEEAKEYRLARQVVPTKRRNVMSLLRVLIISFRWWR